VQTPLFCGQDSRAGAFLLVSICILPFRTSWFIVGKNTPKMFVSKKFQTPNIGHEFNFVKKIKRKMA
jgi:hypothetical protein